MKGKMTMIVIVALIVGIIAFAGGFASGKTVTEKKYKKLGEDPEEETKED